MQRNPHLNKLIFSSLATIALIFVTTVPAFAGATVTIVNVNAPNVGFNDPTPAEPVGGNPGTTVGQQRLIATQFAADIWGANLDSNAEIRIQMSFNPQPCTATTAVLASAGTIQIIRDFPGTEFPNTWYHIALANKRAGGDLIPGPPGTNADDIRATFNSNIGQPNCLSGSSWYYGLNTDEAPSQINLVVTSLHEFAHGLGFSDFVNESTGTKLQGRDDIYIRNVLDTTTGKRLTEMSDEERRLSIINPRRVVWDGANVVAAVPEVLRPGTPSLTINSPADIAGNYLVGEAAFGPPLSSAGLTGSVVQSLDPADAAGATTFDACSPLTNPEAINGNIALVDRGTCTFNVKVKNAQDAGATAVIVVDNAPGGPPPALGGADPTITIPAVRITLADGNRIKAALASSAGVNVTLQFDLTLRAGADSLNRALMNTPDPVQPGSSLSHWDPSAFPNLLMEPAINGDLTFGVKPPDDLTLSLFRDIGWFADADGDGLPDGVDVSPPRFRAASTLTRDCQTGEYVADVTLTNNGTSTANNVQLTTATLGGAGSSTLPQAYGVIRPGESVTRTLRFPSAAGEPGARVVLLLNGTETTTFIGGTFSTGSGKVLPACPQ